MAAVSFPSSAFFKSTRAASTSTFFSANSPSANLSALSAMNFSVWYTSESPALRTSASSRRVRSSSACDSASRIIRSISSLESADPPVIVIRCSLPVPRSFADTCTIPLASISKVTSICGTPRGAGGSPVSSNIPSFLL